MRGGREPLLAARADLVAGIRQIDRDFLLDRLPGLAVGNLAPFLQSKTPI